MTPDVTRCIGKCLKKFSEKHPNESKELTKRIPKKDRGTFEAKKKKIKWIIDEYQEAFEEIAREIEREDYGGKDFLGYKLKSVLDSVYLHPFQASGSYCSKYE